MFERIVKVGYEQVTAQTHLVVGYNAVQWYDGEIDAIVGAMNGEFNRESALGPFLTLIRDIASDAASQSDPDTCLRHLRSGLIRLGFSRVGIWVTDERDPEVLHGTWGTTWDGSELDEHALAGSINSLPGYDRVLAGEPIVLSRIRRPDDPVAPAHQPHVVPASPPNLACLALRADGVLLGIISVDTLLNDTTIDPERAAALGLIADQVAVAVARGRLVAGLEALNATLRAREESLRFLADASRLLAASLDYELTLSELAGLTVPRLADWCVVDIVGSDGRLRRLAAAHPDPVKKQLLFDVVRQYPMRPDDPRGAPLVLRTGQSDVRTELTDADLLSIAQDESHLCMLQALGPRSHLIVPLIARGRRLGVMSFSYGESGRRYTAEDLPLSEDLARRAAVAIDNARLYREAQESLAAARAAGEEVRALNAALESRVAERTAELATVNRELESFSYSVAHDLRSPLRVMDGFSQALLEDYADQLDATGIGYLRQIRKGSQHLGEVIDDLLALSRVTRHEMSRIPVNLSAMCRSIGADLQLRAPSRAVSFDVADEVSTFGDPHLLRIALHNLFENAWKFTERHETARIEFGVDRRGGSPVFFVRDDGAGFNMAHVNRLFGPFQRLHQQAEFSGTGIGLVTVQRIIQRHGGMIWAEGAVEHGATFFFTLDGPQVPSSWSELPE